MTEILADLSKDGKPTAKGYTIGGVSVTAILGALLVWMQSHSGPSSAAQQPQPPAEAPAQRPADTELIDRRIAAAVDRLRSDVAEGDEQLRREVAEKEKYFQTISDGYLRQFEQIRQDRLIREAKIDQTLKELQKGQETNGRLLERILARLPEGGR